MNSIRDVVRGRTGVIALASVVVLFLTGCATTSGPMPTETTAASRESADARDPRTAPVILSGSSGEPVAYPTLVRAALRADVVFVGETHGQPLGLAFAAALWEDMLASSRGRGGALSLEFVERDGQAALDDYITGVTDRDGFDAALERLGAKLPDAHMAMIDASRDAGVRVYAANAPRRYVRLARLEGYDRLAELTEAQRRLFETPDELPTGRYREDFENVMRPMFQGPAHGEQSHGGSHGGGPDPAAVDAQIEAFFRSQSMWDATMADTIVNALSAGKRPVLHVVGRFHTDFAGATEAMVRERRLGARTMSISVIDAARTDLADSDRERADFVVYVGAGEAVASR